MKTFDACNLPLHVTETKTETENGMSITSDDPSSNQEETHDRLALPTISNYTINDRTQGDGTVVLEHSGKSIGSLYLLCS